MGKDAAGLIVFFLDLNQAQMISCVPKFVGRERYASAQHLQGKVGGPKILKEGPGRIKVSR